MAEAPTEAEPATEKRKVSKLSNRDYFTLATELRVNFAIYAELTFEEAAVEIRKRITGFTFTDYNIAGAAKDHGIKFKGDEDPAEKLALLDQRVNTLESSLKSLAGNLGDRLAAVELRTK